MRIKNHRPGPSFKLIKKRNSRKRPLPRWAKYAMRTSVRLTIIVLVIGGPLWIYKSNWIEMKANNLFVSLADRMAVSGLRAEKVILHGRKNASKKNIQKALGFKVGAALLSIDLNTARTNLEALPWIRAASVKREFPDTVRVRIIERRPLAIWQQKNKHYLIDDEGTVITSKILQTFQNLLVLVGKNAPIRAITLINVLERQPELRKRVDAAVRVGDRRWNIRMNNGTYIRLPENNTVAAWDRLAKLERQYRLLSKDILSIDLRIPDQLIIRTRNDQPKNFKKNSSVKGENT
ncbi:MAG: cell division protein FtsQ/DivIB [Pseudomonadota bacterium]|nr:cell division protein FtsQ/DivIB [Pseudomonadota bacterium]